MLIKNDTFLKLMLIIFFLMGVQLSHHLKVIPFSDVVRVSLVFLFLIITIYSSRGRIKKDLMSISFAPLYLLFLFYIWSVLTGFFAGDLFVDSFRRATLAIGTSFLLLSGFIFYRPTPIFVKNTIWFLILFMSVVSLASLVISFFGGSYTGTGTGQHYQTLKIFNIELAHIVHFAGGFPRISGLTPNPNALGLYSGLASTFIVVFYFFKQRSMIVLLPLFIINFSALIHTFSRAAILAFFVSSFVVILLSGRTKFLVTAFISIILAAVLTAIFGDLIVSYFSSRSEQGLSGREYIWNAAWNAFLSNPIFGVGFGLEMENIMEPADIRWSMHNAYMAVLSETGIVGFFIFCLFFVSIFFVILSRVFNIDKENILYFSLVLVLSAIIFISIRSFFETSIFRFTYVNLIYFTFVGFGLFMESRHSNLRV